MQIDSPNKQTQLSNVLSCTTMQCVNK